MEELFTINGKAHRLSFEASATLSEVLRAGGFTEVKEGCKRGECGICAVILDDKLVNSCLVFAASAIGREIKTAQGIGTIHNPHVIQKSFVDAGAVQCGFCTPGKVLAAHCLLQKNPDPGEEQIKKEMGGIVCRCTGYVKIIEAVKLAAKRMKENV